MNPTYIETANQAAKIGGDILVQELGQLTSGQIYFKVNERDVTDYVTDLDHRSEQAIVAHIQKHFPEHSIYAEEQGLNEVESEYQWVIDPLDGTTNYVHGIPFFSVTIALLKNGSPIVGVVLDPVRDECFRAEKGKGAFLNEKKITVGSKPNLESCLLATGFPFRVKSHLDAYLSVFREFFQTAAGVRRMGSAAIDLSYTACGRFDGFWEISLKPWDIGAGVLIMREAGGVVTDFRGEDGYLESGNIIAANPAVHGEMAGVIRRYLGEV